MLVDSIGPDELRLTYDGIQISKEILRQFYAGSEWLQAVATAKEFASSNTQIDWRRYCATELGRSPERLSDPVRQIAENIYPVVANAIARSRGDYLPFPDAWSVERLVSRLREVGLA